MPAHENNSAGCFLESLLLFPTPRCHLGKENEKPLYSVLCYLAKAPPLVYEGRWMKPLGFRRRGEQIYFFDFASVWAGSARPSIQPQSLTLNCCRLFCLKSFYTPTFCADRK